MNNTILKDIIITHKPWNFKKSGCNESPIGDAYLIEAKDKNEEVIGYAHVGIMEGNLPDEIEVDAIIVNDNFQRQGIATAMLVYIENLTGKKVIAHDFWEDGKSLFNNPKRPFGKDRL